MSFDIGLRIPSTSCSGIAAPNKLFITEWSRWQEPLADVALMSALFTPLRAYWAAVDNCISLQTIGPSRPSAGRRPAPAVSATSRLYAGASSECSWLVSRAWVVVTLFTYITCLLIVVYEVY